MPSTGLRPTAGIALAAVLAAAACSSEPTADTLAASLIPTADTIDASYGALEPRIAALDAMAGRRGALTLRMLRTTVEGQPIAFVLVVREGAASLVIDERADGGGIRTGSLPSMRLVREIPSRWVNDVEVEKERFEVVADPAAARGVPGTYLLVHPRCLTAPCTELF